VIQAPLYYAGMVLRKCKSMESDVGEEEVDDKQGGQFIHDLIPLPNRARLCTD
jgi:hypothetical protein